MNYLFFHICLQILYCHISIGVGVKLKTSMLIAPAHPEKKVTKVLLDHPVHLAILDPEECQDMDRKEIRERKGLMEKQAFQDHKAPKERKAIKANGDLLFGVEKKLIIYMTSIIK